MVNTYVKPILFGMKKPSCIRKILSKGEGYARAGTYLMLILNQSGEWVYLPLILHVVLDKQLKYWLSIMLVNVHVSWVVTL